MSDRNLDPRSVERVLVACSSVHCDTHREAAIVGAIGQSMIQRRTVDVNFIQHYAAAAMGWAVGAMSTREARRQLPDTSKPSNDEITDMVKAFREQYNPPEPSAA